MINQSNRPLIIFPQGTRVSPEDRSKFKKGVGRIYENLNINCQPIAHNSGLVWPKHGKLKSNSIITISILKPIPSGLNKEKFLDELQNVIYSEMDRIN